MNKKYIIAKATFDGQIYSLVEDPFQFTIGMGLATLYDDEESAESVIKRKRLKNIFILPLYV